MAPKQGMRKERRAVTFFLARTVPTHSFSPYFLFIFLRIEKRFRQSKRGANPPCEKIAPRLF